MALLSIDKQNEISVTLFVLGTKEVKNDSEYDRNIDKDCMRIHALTVALSYLCNYYILDYKMMILVFLSYILMLEIFFVLFYNINHKSIDNLCKSVWLQEDPAPHIPVIRNQLCNVIPKEEIITTYLVL